MDLQTFIRREFHRERPQTVSTLMLPKSRSDAVDKLLGIKAERSRKYFRHFFRNAWQTLEPDTPLDDSWVIDALCDHVQWIFEEWARKKDNASYAMALNNILFNIPPRCLKSKIISVAAPAWAWLHWPTMTFLCLSANPRVAQDNAEDCLKLIESEWYRRTFDIKWRVAVDRSAVSYFALERPDTYNPDVWIRMGWRKSRGWFSKITGEGADCQLLDDPHDSEEAQGKVKRDAVLRKFDSSIRNRVRDRRTSIRLGIMQRQHEADFTGHVTGRAKQHGAQKWVLVRIPLRYNPKKPCRTLMPVDQSNRYNRKGSEFWRDPRTEDGQIMDPVRFTPEVIESELVEMGAYGAAAQLDQDPSPAEGGQFKRHFWRWFSIAGNPSLGCPRPDRSNDAIARVLDSRKDGLPVCDWITLTVDCTFGSSEKSDNVGMMVIAGIKADRFILHDATAKMDINQTLQKIRELKALYKCNAVLVERKANGQAVIDLLLSEIGSLIPIDPEGGKDSRAHANLPMIEAGNVYLLDGAPWAHDVIDEHAVFPKGKHDDRVDALSQCLTYYRDPMLGKVRASCQW